MSTEEVAKKYGIPHWTSDLAKASKQPGVEAVILATPDPDACRAGRAMPCAPASMC